jgi:hypothetical protein
MSRARLPAREGAGDEAGVREGKTKMAKHQPNRMRPEDIDRKQAGQQQGREANVPTANQGLPQDKEQPNRKGQTGLGEDADFGSQR